MELVAQHSDHRLQLEERIRSLEIEQASLLAEISALRDRLTTLELESHASSLSNEVEALRTEKAVLEEKVATYTTSMAAIESYPV